MALLLLQLGLKRRRLRSSMSRKLSRNWTSLWSQVNKRISRRNTEAARSRASSTDKKALLLIGHAVHLVDSLLALTTQPYTFTRVLMSHAALLSKSSLLGYRDTKAPSRISSGHHLKRMSWHHALATGQSNCGMCEPHKSNQ